MNSYKNQIFISYAREQRSEVESIVNKLIKNDITVWWDSKLNPGDKFRKEIEMAIKSSKHLLLYCTVYSKASNEVKREIKIFRENAKNDPSRKAFVLKGPDCEDKHIPEELINIHRADTIQDVIIYILKEARAELSDEYRKTENDLTEKLNAERAKVIEARQYYRQRRFWEPFVKNRDIHIFSCGRDFPPDYTRPRGTAGYRTSIDKWDYLAVIDITRFFASNYPSVKLTVEHPARRLQQEEISRSNILANRITKTREILRDKDCIIVGSPDVNDFAEIVLSEIHNIDPYDDDRRKSKGFVLIREIKNTPSSFYWEKGPDEYEGIAYLGTNNEIKVIHKHELPDLDKKSIIPGKMHGLLVVADNPFSTTEPKRIMILSGFSGIATSAIAKFLTEDTYLDSFLEFDYEVQAQRFRSIEAVISVKYSMVTSSENTDTRKIVEGSESIIFENLVEL